MIFAPSSSPLGAYLQKIQTGILQPDPYQELAMQHLQRVYLSILSKKRWFILKKQAPVKGLYLWGKVGRGKTQLMDIFYNHLPVPKLRMHFYQFMQEIHQALTQLPKQANPLDRVAEALAHRAQVICLDEFLVYEIADAMLLSQLLHALFQQRITLTTTANTSPNALYQNGLQRELFLPAIKQLEQHLTIFYLDGLHDYRLYREIETDNALQNPFFDMTLQQVQALFNKLSTGKTVFYQPLSIHGRFIAHHNYTENMIWFHFAVICAIPRSYLDYLAIAKIFSTVIISDITAIDACNDNQARLFIQLVDVFYDAGINLILTSRITLTNLYPAGRFFV